MKFASSPLRGGLEAIFFSSFFLHAIPHDEYKSNYDAYKSKIDSGKWEGRLRASQNAPASPHHAGNQECPRPKP